MISPTNENRTTSLPKDANTAHRGLPGEINGPSAVHTSTATSAQDAAITTAKTTTAYCRMPGDGTALRAQTAAISIALPMIKCAVNASRNESSHCVSGTLTRNLTVVFS